MLHVVKRDGREVQFDSIKITHAIKGAAEEIGVILKESEAIALTQKSIKVIEDLNTEKITVEEIQNTIEGILLLTNECKEIGNAYSNYRKE